jgi:hypothetical protein
MKVKIEGKEVFAPEWTAWLAMDQDGSCWAYDKKPTIPSKDVMFSAPRWCECIGRVRDPGKYGKHGWKKTLVRVPKAVATDAHRQFRRAIIRRGR